jgi:hypothetical protein
VQSVFPPTEAWAEFQRMRKSIRKPMTAYAEKLMLKRLLEMVENDGQDAQAVLDQSILNCWQNIYCVKVEQVLQAVSPAQLRVVPNANWWASDAGIIRKGQELHMHPRPGETFATFKDRIFNVLNNGQRAAP